MVYQFIVLPPAFVDLDTKLSIFETGIKVVDLLAPYRRGGENWALWRLPVLV